MSYDPLFRSTGEPDYFWCSYWENRSGIPDAELPHAGPGTFPPPLMAGQQGCFRIYDDTTADQLVTATAVEANGLPLQWVETHREKVPRAMVGTYNALSDHLESAMKQLAVYQMQAREKWLASRFSLHTHGRYGEKINPERFREICTTYNLKFERRVGFKDGHEELWVNGEFDSAFTLPKIL